MKRQMTLREELEYGDNYQSSQSMRQEYAGGIVTTNAYPSNRQKVVHTSQTAKAAKETSDRANEIKYKHMTALNKAFLSLLDDVLPIDVINNIKQSYANLKNPQSLGGNETFQNILQQHSHILNQYDHIASKISEAVDPWVNKFHYSQVARQLEKTFLDQFDLSEFFHYPKGGNGTSTRLPIECKDHIHAIAQEFKESITPLVQAMQGELHGEHNMQGGSGDSGQAQHNQTEPLIAQANLDDTISLSQQIEQLREHIPEDDPEFSQLLSNIEERASHSSGNSQANKRLKQEIQQELDWIKNTVNQHQDQINTIAQKQEELACSFSKTEDTKLKDYYNGFINEFSICFTGAQTVRNGGVKQDGTKSVKVKVTAQLAKLIPLLGDITSSAIQEGADYKANLKAQHKCLNISKFGISHGTIEKLAKYMAVSILENPAQKQLIEEYQLPEATTFMQKAGKFAGKVKNKLEDAVHKLETDMSSPQEMLGHEHAREILKDYICTGKFFDYTQSNRLDEIVQAFIRGDVLIDEQEQNDEHPQKEEEDVDAPVPASSSQANSGHQEQAEMLQPAIPKSTAVIEGINDGEEQQEDELTPKSKQIKEMQEMMDRMREEIQTLKTNHDSEKWISREAVQQIMQDNTAEKDILLDDNQTLQQESQAKDEIIADRDKTIKEQKDNNTELSQKYTVVKEKLQREVDINKEYKSQIKDLRTDKAELRAEKNEWKQNADEWKAKANEKDIKITQLEGLLAGNESTTEIIGAQNHSVEQEMIEVMGQNAGTEPTELLS